MAERAVPKTCSLGLRYCKVAIIKSFSRKNQWETLPNGLKSTVGRIFGFVSPGLLLGRNFRRWVKIAQDADQWSAEQVQHYQIEQVKHICLLAQENSTYYAESFRQAGFSPAGMKSLDELERLPTIDKHTINQHQDGLLTRPKWDLDIDRVSTGGSSGEPLSFMIGSDRSSPEFAHLVVAWQRAGYSLLTPQAVLRGQVISKDKHGIHHYYDPLLRRHNYSNFYMNDDSMERYLRHMETIGDCYLHTYPSSLNMLVRYMRRSGSRPPSNIKGLLVGSENVYEDDRRAAESLFDTRYFSWYGHSEKLVFAAECEHSTAYHVSPSYGYCELVDQSGKRITKPGERGEIVGTGYINTVMPFIRYRTGDFATYLGDSCEKCNRNHMLIGDVQGHNTLEMLIANDNSLIPWAACNVHDNSFDGVLQFQFQQKEVGKTLLKVVAAGELGNKDLERIVRSINLRLQGRITCTIALVDKISLTKNGKSVFVDQKLDINKVLESGEN